MCPSTSFLHCKAGASLVNFADGLQASAACCLADAGCDAGPWCTRLSRSHCEKHEPACHGALLLHLQPLGRKAPPSISTMMQLEDPQWGSTCL